MLSIKIDDWVRQYINQKFESIDEIIERTPSSYKFSRLIDTVPFDWEVDEHLFRGLFPITFTEWLRKTYPQYDWGGPLMDTEEKSQLYRNVRKHWNLIRMMRDSKQTFSWERQREIFERYVEEKQSEYDSNKPSTDDDDDYYSELNEFFV